jgi:twinkle protein
MSEVIKEFKQKIGAGAEQIIAQGLNLQKVGQRYRCPNGMAHKHGDRNPSMSWDRQRMRFHCFGCDMSIDIYGYYRDHLNYTHGDIMDQFGQYHDIKSLPMQNNRDTFLKGVQALQPITAECIEYIKSRGITEDTIAAFELKSHNGDIAFPYYKHETLVGVKTRRPCKWRKTDGNATKLRSITGSKPYLFNAKNIEPGGELIICEGEFDCMVLWQCGYTNVVSVGAGANSMRTVIEQGDELFKQFDSLLIVSDNDESGDNMDAAFMEKYGSNAKLLDKSIYKRNDINEDYVKYGREQIVKLIDSAKLKVEGMRDMEENPYRGLKTGDNFYIPTGIKTLDYAMNDLCSGDVTLITGRSNGGKTTFCTQIQANAIDKGYRVLIISGEGKQEELINNFYTAVIGRKDDYYDVVQVNKKQRKEPKPHVLAALQKWHYKKLRLFTKGDSKLKTSNELFNMLAAEIKLNKHHLVVVDNLMSVLSVEKASEKLEAQADFLQRCCDLAKAYNVHIIVVLHPNKTYVKGQDMDFEYISGTGDMANKSDNIIAVVREYDEDKVREGISGRIQLLKNRYYPELVRVNVHYDPETRMLLEVEADSGRYVAYSFGLANYMEDAADWSDIAREVK